MPIELTGMNELLKSLKEKGKDVEAAESEAIQAGAEVVRKSISEMAPVGTKRLSNYNKKRNDSVEGGINYLSEHLKDNIVISEVKSKDGEKYVDVGPQEDFYYAKFLEFGTVNMKSKPFIEPGVIKSRDEAMSAMAEVVNSVIGKGE